MNLDANDLVELKKAKRLLQNPGITAKIISMLEIPIEKGLTKEGAPVRALAHHAGGRTLQHSSL